MVAVMRLLTVKELPACQDNHNEDDPAELGSKECHSDKEHYCSPSDVFDDGLAAVSHALPARNQRHGAAPFLCDQPPSTWHPTNAPAAAPTGTPTQRPLSLDKAAPTPAPNSPPITLP